MSLPRFEDQFDWMLSLLASGMTRATKKLFINSLLPIKLNITFTGFIILKHKCNVTSKNKCMVLKMERAVPSITISPSSLSTLSGFVD